MTRAAVCTAIPAMSSTTCPVFLGGGTVRAEYYRERIVAAFVAAGCLGAIRTLPRTPQLGAACLARAVARGEAPLDRWIDG